MPSPTDDELARPVRADQRAFLTPVHRFERSLWALVRACLGPVYAVPDVLQGKRVC